MLFEKFSAPVVRHKANDDVA